jgi:hypothetical protein
MKYKKIEQIFSGFVKAIVVVVGSPPRFLGSERGVFL